MRYLRALLTGYALTSVAVPSSCYRAEIDLAPLLDASDSHAGSASGAGAETSPAGGEGGATPDASRTEAGQASISAGGSGEGGVTSEQAGAAGAPAECDGSWRDTVEDTACRQGGPPTRAECVEQPLVSWRGCYDGGCTVCTDLVESYPYYFKWHPCCIPNHVCSNHQPVLCNSRCPPPTEHDRIPPCGALDPNPG